MAVVLSHDILGGLFAAKADCYRQILSALSSLEVETLEVMSTVLRQHILLHIASLT